MRFVLGYLANGQAKTEPAGIHSEVLLSSHSSPGCRYQPEDNKQTEQDGAGAGKKWHSLIAHNK